MQTAQSLPVLPSYCYCEEENVRFHKDNLLTAYYATLLPSHATIIMKLIYPSSVHGVLADFQLGYPSSLRVFEAEKRSIAL
jgi:hypothetical protein